MKYIVEADEVRIGECASTGGIRDKEGKMVSQYKKPVPYKEPPQRARQEYMGHSTYGKGNQAVKRKKKGGWLKGMLAEAGKDIITDAVGMVWNDFGRPIVRSKLEEAEKWAMDKWESKGGNKSPQGARQDMNPPAEVRREQMAEAKTPSNVIQFPLSRAV